MNIIISPSGKLYGSEQVLLDYLGYTRNEFSIYVFGRDVLYEKLKKYFSRHRVQSFGKVKWLYFRILVLCLQKRVNTVYVNEAGHSRYIILLARLVPFVKFILHVRLVEDTGPERWKGASNKNNLTVLSISEFLADKLPVTNIQMYDPYIFRESVGDGQTKQKDSELIIGIIGRVSQTKGIDLIIGLLEKIDSNNLSAQFTFEFFGEIMPEVISSGQHERLKSFGNVRLNGFVLEKQKMYDAIDGVLHAAEMEPLGRIFLEAVNFNKPLIGINSGGIGEIGKKLGLTELLVNPAKENKSEELLQKLMFLKNNYQTMAGQIAAKKDLASKIFSPVQYAEKLDVLTGAQPLKQSA